MKLITLTLTLICCTTWSAHSQPDPLSGFSALKPLIDEQKGKCLESQFDQDLCETLFEQVIALTGLNPVSKEEALEQLKKKAEAKLSSPEFLNEKLLQSAAIKGLTNGIPLSLEFKSIDKEDGDSVVGLEYKYEHKFKSKALEGLDYNFTFTSEGTITQDADENPRNFIDTKISFAGFRHSVFNEVTDEVGETLQVLADEASKGNKGAKKQALQMINDSIAPLNGFYYFAYGLDGGLESDQQLKAKNKKLSGYLFGQYDFWDRSNLLGALGLTVGARLAIQNINPNSETPRALVGDSSDYLRANGEMSLSLPLGKVAGYPVDLIMNYRTYQELDASAVVKTANLDRYHLRTYALRGPYGMYVSYASGRLPFDKLSDQTVELGIKWYF